MHAYMTAFFHLYTDEMDIRTRTQRAIKGGCLEEKRMAGFMF